MSQTDPMPEERLKKLTPEQSLYDIFKESAQSYLDFTAYNFLGFRSTYRQLLNEINRCSNALYKWGVRKGDRVLVSLPTCPQSLIIFYAINRLGAVSNIIHPLSSAAEIEFALDRGQSRWAITLDLFFKNIYPFVEADKVDKLIVTKITDYQNFIRTWAFRLRYFKQLPRVRKTQKVIWWKELMEAKGSTSAGPLFELNELAAILYTGGTDGNPKAVKLSNYNFNYLSISLLCHQIKFNYKPGDKVLATLPIFHGFGLAVVVHSTMLSGGNCLLVPRFVSKQTANLIKKEKPHILAGVPTFFEALLKEKRLKNTDFSPLKGAFVGGDTVPSNLIERFNRFLLERGSQTQLLEGYGLTECVSACTFMPPGESRKGSAGGPLVGISLSITDPGKDQVLPPEHLGEICISGPTIMMGYLDDEKASKRTLRTHADGKLWLHSGDIGKLDREGYLYVDHRLKRVIKSSGMSVIPQQVEKILSSHPEVSYSCVIGIPDNYQIHKVKALIALKDKNIDTDKLQRELLEICEKNLSKWSIPKIFEFRAALPLTKYGKVDYRQLEKEHQTEVK